MSSLYETEPLGFESKNNFYNLVVKIRTSLSAPALLLELKKIEFSLGRVSSNMVTDRVIDIDIVLYEDLILENEVLSIPHPRAWERAFVLYPLLDMDEPIQDPKSGRSLVEIIGEKRKILADQMIKNLKFCPLV